MIRISIFLLLFSAAVVGSEKEESAQDEAAELEQRLAAKSTAAESSSNLNDSLVRSMVNSWGISEEQAGCLLEDLTLAQLATANSNPDVKAVFDSCGVDPSVVN